MARSDTEILDWLLADEAIDRSQHAAAAQHFAQRGGSVLESLLEVDSIAEDVVLKHLANRYKTRFVTTAKLRKADIDKKILDRLPVELAIKNTVFPILFDAENNTLSYVTADPSNLAVEQAISRTARGLRVRAFLARPAAIKAAISKFYRGDMQAFSTLDRQSNRAVQAMMGAYEPNMLDESAMSGPATARMSGRGERMLGEEEFSAPKTKAKAAKTSAPPPEPERMEVAPDTSGVVGVARVLVSLLEGDRGDLSGHSLLTASHTERVCARIGISAGENDAITLAALLHDLGKGEPYHLTPLNVAEWDGHRTTALKRFETPVRLFEAAKLPHETAMTLRHMYERFDGQGFPDGLKGTEIPLGARILALSDTYADLTSNQRNPFRKILGTAEAMDVLEKGRGKVFDPNLVSLFGAAVAGDDLKRQLLTGAQTILVIESDPESCAILDMQLTTRGFRIRTARASDAALALLEKETVGLVLSEVDLKPFDGFELKKRLNATPKLKKIPFFYFTARSAASDVQKGFELGAQDYLVKPLTVEIVAMKIQKFLETTHPAEAKGGVSGSLKEMSIPDLVQIIAHGRKTGCLRLTSGAQQGEIHFVNGDLYNALCGKLRGDDAFFALLKFRDGSFALDPSFTATDRAIQRTAEMMLLEGLRRYDEENK
jgi:response regulator RpfG family c-di-GMP phosphodiesterase